MNRMSTPFNRQSGQILILLLGGLLFGGSLVTGVYATGRSFSELKDVVTGMGMDSDREQQVMSLLDSSEKTSRGPARSFNRHTHRLVRLVQKQDANAEQFGELFAKGDEQLLVAEKSLLQNREQLRQLLSRTEWNTLFNPENEKGFE